MQAEELDAKFDVGESVLKYFNLSTVKRGGTLTKTISIDIPISLWRLLEQKARKTGLETEALVENWITHQLETLYQE